MFLAHENFLLIVSAPSGAGKSTLCNMLIEEDKLIAPSISFTTRPQRPGEILGKEYQFVSEDQFQQMVQRDEFIEHAKVFGYYYGTIKGSLRESLSKGYDILLNIDWQGARQIRENFPRDEVISVFILPPSLEVLEERLRGREQDPEETITYRMNLAKREIRHFEEYDFVIINQDLNKAYQELRAIVINKRLQRTKKEDLQNFVAGFLQ